MTSQRVTLLCALVIGTAMSCPAWATVIASPNGNEARRWNLITGAREISGGVAASIRDARVVSTNPADRDALHNEHSHYFELSYSAMTGTLRLGVDVSRNGVFETTEVLSRTFDSYVYRSFLRARIGVSGVGIGITDLTVNGVSLGSLPFTNQTWTGREILRTNQALSEILITGNLVFGDGHRLDQWPTLWLRLRDDVAYTQQDGGLSIREPTGAAVLGIGLAGWLLARRRGHPSAAR